MRICGNGENTIPTYTRSRILHLYILLLELDYSPICTIIIIIIISIISTFVMRLILSGTKNICAAIVQSVDKEMIKINIKGKKHLPNVKGYNLNR